MSHHLKFHGNRTVKSYKKKLWFNKKNQMFEMDLNIVIKYKVATLFKLYLTISVNFSLTFKTIRYALTDRP